MKLLICILISIFIECSHTSSYTPIRFIGHNDTSEQAVLDQEVEMPAQYTSTSGPSTSSKHLPPFSSASTYEMPLENKQTAPALQPFYRHHRAVPYTIKGGCTMGSYRQAYTANESTSTTVMSNSSHHPTRFVYLQQADFYPQAYRQPGQEYLSCKPLIYTSQSIPQPMPVPMQAEPPVLSDTMPSGCPEEPKSKPPESKRSSLSYIEEIFNDKIWKLSDGMLKSTLLKDGTRIDHFFQNTACCLYAQFVKMIAGCKSWSYWTFKWDVMVSNVHRAPRISNIRIVDLKLNLRNRDRKLKELLSIIAYTQQDFETNICNFLDSTYMRIAQKAALYGLCYKNSTSASTNPTLSATTGANFKMTITQLYGRLIGLLLLLKASPLEEEAAVLEKLIYNAYIHVLYLNGMLEQMSVMTRLLICKSAEIYRIYSEEVSAARVTRLEQDERMRKRRAILNDIYTRKNLKAWINRKLDKIFEGLYGLGHYTPRILFKTVQCHCALSTEVSAILYKCL